MTPEQEAMLEDALALPWSVRVKPVLGGTVFHASTPELPGCVSAGETEQEARTSLVEWRRGILAGMIQAGLPIPSPLGG